MTWRKLGHVFEPSGELDWAKTHAANPVAEHVEGDEYRVYFSARDERNRSSIGFVRVRVADDGIEIVDVPPEPVLRPGELAMFDDSGASVGCIVPVGEARYLYYMGWNLSVTVPWKNALGLAISEKPGGPFRRVSRFPVVPLDESDPYTISYPWILRENGRFRMWYGSNLRWGSEKRDMLHVIKYAESSDGVEWEKADRVVIDSSGPEEYAICKPCVVKDGGRYTMWFCSRGDAYRIEIADSGDGIDWVRRGRDPGIDVSEQGWDSEMIEYPFVFDHAGRRYLLYAGNDFGRTGFGAAVLEP